jgi:dehydrogenase/reductase SDR family protein 12
VSRTSGFVDAALDRSIVGGYTKIGYWARRRHWDPNDPRTDSMRDKVALVTGANSGLGKATAAGLAGLGATVHLLVRNEERGRTAREEILRDVPGASLEVTRLDVSDLDDVREVATLLADHLDGVDVLVHNAGVMPKNRQESPQGHELALATHVLGPLLLTEVLAPALARAHGRVVLVTSGGMYTQKVPVEDPEYARGEYKGATSYARSKRIQVALTPLMQGRWEASGASVHVMHPGWADTPGISASLPGFSKLTRPLLRDAETGADTVVWLAATDPAPPGGLLWQDRAPRPEHYRRATRETDAERDAVWRFCLNAVGLD